MYSVKKTGDELWTVGIIGDTIWVPLRDFSRESKAFAFINYLNGGTGKLFA